MDSPLGGGLIVIPANTGNVGIGSMTPGQALDVKGTVRTTSFAMTGQTPISGYVLTASDSAGDTTWTSAGSVSGWTVSGNGVYETLNGNVGIGTSALQTALAITNGNVGIGTWTAAGGALIVSNGAGNVGIGSAWPGTILDVQGTIRSLQNIEQGGAVASGTNNATALGWTVGGGTITSYGGGSLAGGTAQISGGATSATISATNSSEGAMAYGFSLALGGGGVSNISATSEGSIAMGWTQNGTILSSGNGSIAMGYSVGILQATANGSVAIGDSVQATANDAQAFGSGVINNTASTIMMGFSATPTLTVTGTNVGIGTFNPFGGKLIVTGGNVGIGSLAPGQALDITGTARMTGFTLSNNGAAAGNIMVTNAIGVGTWMPVSTLNVSGTNYWLNTTAAGNVGVSTTNTVGIGTTAGGIGTGLVVMNGNVGIGTWVPSHSLDIIGNLGVGTIVAGDALVVNPSGTVAIAQGSRSPLLALSIGGGSSSLAPPQIYFNSYSSSAGYPQLIGNWLSTGIWGIGPASNSSTDNNLEIGPAGSTESAWSTILRVNLVIPYGNIGINTTNTATSALAVMGGNVGIGTWIPGQMLDVLGTARMTGFTLSNNGAAAGNIMVTNAIGVGTWMPVSTLNVSGTNYWLNTTAAGNVGVSTTNTVGIGTTAAGVGTGLTVMNGNVGIGTWAPGGSLVVIGGNVGIGTTTPQTGLVSMSNVGIGTWTAAGGNLIINGGGNVGIGSAWPGASLDVNGTVRFLKGIEQGNDLASGNFSVAFGWGTNGSLNASGGGSMVSGYGPGAQASITATTFGSWAGGDANWGAGAGATITSSGAGSLAFGSANSTVSSTAAISATSIGAIALGYVNETGTPASILSSGPGSFAEGISTGTLQATGTGRVAMGQNVQATATNALAVGLSVVNPNAFSFMVGFNATPTLTVTGTGVGIGTSSPFGGGLIVLPANTGNVGIGSLTPGQALDVKGTVRTTALAMSGQTPISGYVLTASDSAGDTTWTSAGSVSGWTVSGNGVYETLNGNVGIGTSALQTALAVTNGNVGIGTWTAAGGSLIIKGSGNVGIGSAWPGTLLDVQGTARTLGAVVNGNVGIGTYFGNEALAVMNGSVGIGTWSGLNTLDVKGGIAAGAYAGINAPSINGMIISGNVGIGTINALGALQVRTGTDQNGFFQPNQNLLDGVAFSSVNDQNTANKGLELRGSIVQLSTIGANPIYFLTNDAANSQSTIRETIDKNGNIGIGTVGNGGVLNQRLTVVGNIGVGTSGPPGDLFTNNAPPNGGMLIESNVGIGSANPGQILDVKGTVRTTGLAMSGQTPISGYVLTASDSAGDTTWTSAGAVSGWTVSGNGVYESLNGNVGIGTSALQTALAITNGNVGIGTWTAAGGSLIINTGGNVGIGSAWPGQVLDVNGTARVSGNVGIGSSITDSSGSARLTISSTTIEVNLQ